MRSLARLTTCLFLAVGCDPAPEPLPAAPVSELRGAVVIEPARIAIGDVASVEITVVTPPGHRVRPVRPPGEVAGFWLLDAKALPVARSPSRWVHRTRLRARARETGSFAWPAMTLEVETPEESVALLALEERPLQVESVASRFPEQVEPFPLRGQSEPGGRFGFAGPAALGAVASSLAIGAAAALVRRSRRRRARDAPAHPVQRVPAWRAAQATLEAALELSDVEPERCADSVSAALRRFVAERYPVSASTLTTEELRECAAPLGAERHWPTLLAILDELDALRFRAKASDAPWPTHELRAAIARAQELVAAAAPEVTVR
jgi:hypothetical protein